MQTSLKPLQHQCGIATLPNRISVQSKQSPRLVPAANSRRNHQAVSTCASSDSDTQRQLGFLPQNVLGIVFAAALSVTTLSATESALAKTNPVKKADPYEDLQNIIKSRGGGGPSSLFESFQKQAQEAAKIPAEVLKAPTEIFKPAPEPPAIPLPITKALPQPASKAAAAAKSEGPSVGLLAGVGAVVLAAAAAISSRTGNKAAAQAPKPNQIKAKVKAGAKQVSKQASKQAPKPTFSLPSLGGKAQQVGKTAKVKAGSAPQKAKQAASSGKGLFGLAKQATPQKAKQAASSGKGLFGTTSVKAKQAAPQKAKQAASNGKSLFGTASVKAKQAASTTGLFGTASTRGKSSTPATGGGILGTRSTRPTSGGTTKVKAAPASKPVAAAKKAVASGGSSLVDEDTGTTVGLLGVVGLAVAVGALALSSLTGSVGGGAASAPAEVKQLLDRVPEPLPVVKKAQQAATQVSSRVQDAAPSQNFQPPPVPSPKDTLPPVAQTPQTPSGPDLVPELMQKPKTGAPLAPPPSDATKPKIPSGPDLRVPGPSAPSLGPSLGAAPQLANGPPPSPAKAADKVSQKASEAVPQLAQAPKAAEEASSQVAQGIPKTRPADPSTSVGSPIIVLALAGAAVFGVLFAKQAQPGADSKGSEAAGNSPASSNGTSASSAQAPQSAGEAAADAKKRAKEAREWIDNWKSKQ